MPSIIRRVTARVALLTAALTILLTGCAAPGSPAPAPGGAARAEIVWLGQAAFKITSPAGKVIVTDPWLRTNPLTPAAYKQLDAFGRIDVLLVSHGHFDHIADAPALAQQYNVPIRAPGDLNQTLTTLGVLNANLLNGFRIYHAGDTAAFGDMRLIGERFRPDVALVPIGGNFTMDPAEAAWAVKELIRPKQVIPMHYGANPLTRGTAKEFVDAIGPGGVPVIVAVPGHAISLP